jgi:hypothetical protein
VSCQDPNLEEYQFGTLARLHVTETVRATRINSVLSLRVHVSETLRTYVCTYGTHFVALPLERVRGDESVSRRKALRLEIQYSILSYSSITFKLPIWPGLQYDYSLCCSG